MWRTKIRQISKVDCRRACAMRRSEQQALIKVESWLQTPNQGRPPSDWGLLVEGSWGNAEQHEGWHTSKVTHWNKIPRQEKIIANAPVYHPGPSRITFSTYRGKLSGGKILLSILQHRLWRFCWSQVWRFHRHYWSGLINPNTANHHDFTLASVNWSNQGW